MHITINYSESRTNRDLSYIFQYGSSNELCGMDKIKALILPSASNSKFPSLNKYFESKQTIKERNENLRYYNEIKDDLYRNYLGKYAVIANGQLQQIGDTFDDIKDVAIDAHHRFIFKVERNNLIKRKTRWPMRPKR